MNENDNKREGDDDLQKSLLSSPSGGGDAIVGIPWESKQWGCHKKLVELTDLEAAHTL